MDLYDAIEQRRSIRVFTDQPVEREKLDRMIEAAVHAPSTHNMQPWFFHVTTGTTRDALCEIVQLSTVHLQEYLEMLPKEKLEAVEDFFARLGGAPVVIAVSAPVAEDQASLIAEYLSTGCAIENLLLAAVEEGLSTCNVTFAFWVRDKLAELLDIGADREIVSLILVGYAGEEPELTPRNSNVAIFLN